jgi:hypothetical protein
MNEKKLKVNASFGSLGFDVYVTVPQDAWDKQVDFLEEEVKVELSNSEWDDGFDVNDYDSVQELMESQLVWSNPYSLILCRLGALEQLRDAMVEDLVKRDTEHQFENELQMLKGIKDFERTMIEPFGEPGDAPEDEKFVVIWNNYPQDLLDELARRFEGIQKK